MVNIHSINYYSIKSSVKRTRIRRKKIFLSDKLIHTISNQKLIYLCTLNFNDDFIDFFYPHDVKFIVYNV